MAVYFTNVKNWCVGGTQYCLGCVKNLGARIIHSKIVQSNVEKISFVGGYVLMTANQYFFGKKHLSIPKAVQNNILNGKHADLDKLIGWGSSPIADHIKTPVLDMEEFIRGSFSGDEEGFQPGEEWVSKHALPKQILEERFKDFRNVVLASQLYLPASYFKHSILYSRSHNDILLLVDGQYMGSKEIVATFRLENRAATERMFLPSFVVNKKTNKKYAYLDKGLTQHDVEKDIRPYQILPDGQRPKKPMIKFNFCIDSKLDSPEDAANFFYHTWCEVIQPDGKCYGFGLFGKGVVQCPDPSVFRKNDVRSISFEISQAQILAIFGKIDQLRKERKGKYHFTKWNCATLMKEICSLIHIDIPGRGQLKAFDNMITRIKIYAISSILANLLRDPDIVSKIGTLQEFANLLEHVNDPLSSIKGLISKFSLKKSFQTIPSSNALENHPNIRKNLLTVYALLQRLVKSFDEKKISKFYEVNLISATELKELCRSTLTGSVKELTYKIHNLLNHLFSNYYEYEMDSPGFVYALLKQEQHNRLPAYRRYLTII